MSRAPKVQPPPPAGYVWIEEAANRLGQAKTTLYKWRQKDVGPTGVEFGRKLAYRIADIDAYLDERYAAATAPKPAEPEPEPLVPAQHRRARRQPVTAGR
jgi:predicted DNA-binding transcriptional regulator AlpA